MKKIVLLPLDERPCNAAFPGKLFNGTQVRIVTPQCLGNKKTPANAEALTAFLWEQCRDADGLILSMDMLLYGGLLPSRLHHLSKETVTARMEQVRALKRQYPALTIYAFQCIMRCPAYSSSDEEPDYYGQYGAQIHHAGIVYHHRMLGQCSEAELEAAMAQVPEAALRDYRERRAFNLYFNQCALELVRENVLDYLVLPQDDSAPYGYTALDQMELRTHLAGIESRAVMYPGADEVGLTLISRMLLRDFGRRPRVFVRYAAEGAPRVIPAYEDRSLGETVKAHLMAAGCRMASCIAEADFVLALSCPGGKMEESDMQPVRNAAYCAERNLTEFVLELRDLLAEGKRVILCDNAYANGADLELIAMMDSLGLLGKLSGYAGWNTSANSMGTALAQGVYTLLFGRPSMDFLMLRYVEDVLYCAIARKWATTTQLEALGMNYFDIREPQGEVSRILLDQLTRLIPERLSGLSRHIALRAVRMPWSRMFETDLTVQWVP